MVGMEQRDGSTHATIREGRRVTPEPGSRGASERAHPTPARPVVVKVGGRSLEAPGASRELASAVASFSGGAILVHGGGRDVTDWCARLAIEPRFADGLRVTDAATLDVAVAVLAGLSNKRLVAALRAGGADAVGLAALDSIAEVAPTADVRLGAVGEIVAVHTTLLETLLAQGRTPVLASIGAHEGALLNLNADTLAGSIAAALQARALVLLSDVPGLALDGTHVPQLDPAQLDDVLAHPDAKDGMRPKLRAARDAVRGGASCAVIGAWSGPGSLARLLAGTVQCTTIVAAAIAPDAVATSGGRA